MQEAKQTLPSDIKSTGILLYQLHRMQSPDGARVEAIGSRDTSSVQAGCATRPHTKGVDATGLALKKGSTAIGLRRVK